MKMNSSTNYKNEHYSIASLHSRYIDGGILATLGLRFLTLLYEAIDRDTGSVMLVYRMEGEVAGFGAGTDSSSGIYRQLLPSPLKLI